MIRIFIAPSPLFHVDYENEKDVAVTVATQVIPRMVNLIDVFIEDGDYFIYQIDSNIIYRGTSIPEVYTKLRYGFIPYEQLKDYGSILVVR